MSFMKLIELIFHVHSLMNSVGHNTSYIKSGVGETINSIEQFISSAVSLVMCKYTILSESTTVYTIIFTFHIQVTIQSL